MQILQEFRKFIVVYALGQFDRPATDTIIFPTLWRFEWCLSRQYQPSRLHPEQETQSGTLPLEKTEASQHPLFFSFFQLLTPK